MTLPIVPSVEGPSPRQPWWRRWFGLRSERRAERFLKRKGHRILTRNWRCQQGELDLVTRQGPVLVFVEVRSTSHRETESARLSVDVEKQRRLTQVALVFIQRYRLFDTPARFDVVTIAWPKGAHEPFIEHFENAFPAQFQPSMFA
ncbi:MAG TPA: YraN family protein [Gemmatales bacterium]|nr:YraN family protein [Gemmatales bacterium]HMP15581.1 YraN family protein [Gemmatales bacterium]